MSAEEDMAWWVALKGAEIETNTEGFPPYDAARVAKLITQALGAPRGILDFGCGTGRLMGEVMRLLPDSTFYGVDIADEMLLRARERLPKASFTRRLMPGTVFDAAYSVTVFQHIDDAEARSLLSGIFDHLAPGGRFVCQFDYGDPRGEHAGPHNYPRFGPEVRDMMLVAGFTDVRLQRDAVYDEWLWVTTVKP